MIYAKSGLALSGAIATAVAFGPARMGFGLFVPTLTEQFSIGTTTVGIIESAAFAAFLAALLGAAYLVKAWGPRVPVLAGCFSAALGAAIVAGAHGVLSVAVGTIVAATSAGFCWSPFNEAAGRAIAVSGRGRALSIISTGTTIGIVLAGVLAVLAAQASGAWRMAWMLFAFSALVAAGFNARALNNLPPRRSGLHFNLKRLLNGSAMPLYMIALSFGVTNGVYISFGVHHVAQTGGIAGVSSAVSGALIYIGFGCGGAVGFLTADIRARFGLTALVRGIFGCSALSLLLIGLAPNAWSGVLGSAVLQGACVMVLSAIYSFWSDRLAPDLSTLSFTVVLSIFALGNAIGPATAGFAAGAIGMTGVFVAGSVISIATSLLFPRVERRLAHGVSNN